MTSAEYFKLIWILKLYFRRFEYYFCLHFNAKQIEMETNDTQNIDKIPIIDKYSSGFLNFRHYM